MIEREYLLNEYVQNKRSVKQISNELGCSENKINYWLVKHGIKKRSRSEALYAKYNPEGDPFKFKKPKSSHEWFLYGLGLGIYWGEGNKANTHTVRLANTDADLIRAFLEFLDTTYRIDRSRLRFGLQVFSDIEPDKAVQYWCKKLKVNRSAFQKVVLTPSVSQGTYKKRCKYGVLMIYFSNIKLRDSIVSAIDTLRT